MNKSPVGAKAPTKSSFYYCEHCNFSTVHYSRMNSHSVVHSSMRPYQCEQCSYAAKRKSDLKKHIIYRHKIEYLGKSNSTPKAAPTTVPSTSSTSTTTLSVNKSQQCTTADKPFVYTLLAEQVAPSPLSINDESSDVSIQSNPALATIKLEINDDVEIVPTHQSPFEHNNTLQQTSSSLSVDVPISVSLPSTIFQMTKLDNNNICMSSLGGSQIITTPISNQQTENPNSIATNQLIFPRNIVVTTKDASVGPIQSSFCTHCQLLFFDNGLYAMHMGLHHAENPWQCNICGQVHNDVYSFTLHFITHHQTDMKQS
ncbi:zinc finger protein Pegasus isoform X1 [Octopus bimaculoides]|uniref:C2H2-type domain-containing protein n=1 Tax=Octopus bimaculoides TaxID=37653 RepID=A0A0L8GPE3_OCTBM|nr:zinc finger protein Pegasus isoform X1 [Octopus bimaculoides]XP_014779178.1 zinc finger protein Pegasus isoform X1 [Octopus bimaculoides]XP_014779179.1 zinc finger protein Pegasus isoform X1 [Octopus bimaculoides]XP_052821938.1 zinc finger protein Pegasus isoform X1 [Octopus bimaculoides]XP_052821940.1 zinc finger protein Pegasus isoform X1 [Octopus bimaculoides]|eukprot:XP_014779177.1 PREDICTED: zinc finger protein Pegasus-like [Octopus bimaculoides]